MTRKLSASIAPIQNPFDSKTKDQTAITISPSIAVDDAGDDRVYELGICEKVINVLLCRSDLTKQKLTAKPVSLFQLFRFGSIWDRAMFLVGTLCAVVAGISQPVLAIIAGRMINVLLYTTPTSDDFLVVGYQQVFIFLGIGVFILITGFIQYMCFQASCSRIIAQIRHRYMQSILRQNAAWFDVHHSGVLVTRLNDNVERIREGIGDKLGLLVRGLSMFVTAIIISFIYSWRMALAMLGVAPATTIIMSLLARMMGSTTVKELAGIGLAGAIAEEAILGVRTVQSFNAQSFLVHRYREQLEKGKRFGVQKGLWSGFLGGFFFFVLFVFLGGGMYYGGWLLYNGLFSNAGQVFVVVMSMLMAAYFLGLVSPHLMVLLNARVAAATIYATIEREGGRKPEGVKGRVTFKDVHFRYPTRPDVTVLNGFDLTVEPGQTVALVGHSGCGKSTSVSLLTRLYEAESGTVCLDGEDVRSLNITWLRTAVGVVQQEPILFNDTIAANLKMGKCDINEKEMIAICKMANAHDFIMKLPQGYDTMIGDGGVQLSGGQKQRVAIARTLARDPRVLLLDEATSALDAHSEAVVQAALNNAARGRSTIVIAHRLSTIRNADKIVVLDKGQVRESGTHIELIALGGLYCELVKAQQFQSDTDSGALSTLEEENEDGEGEIEFRQRLGSMESTRSAKMGMLTRDSLRMSIAGEFLGVVDEPPVIEVAEMEEMLPPDVIKPGYWQIFANARGDYIPLFIGLLIGIIRGLELPALSLIFGFVFHAFFGPREAMLHELIIALILYIALGVLVTITQFASSALFGLVSENLTLKFRVKAFNNILHQDAAYFDNPQHAPGKLITRLATDAPNIKAVVDSRMLQVIYGLTALVACTAIGFVYSWQVALMGTCLAVMLGVMQITLGHLIQNRNLALAKHDEAGRLAIEGIESVRTLQLLTRTGEFFDKFVIASKRQKHSELQKGPIEAVNFSISQCFTYLVFAICLAVGLHVIHIQDKRSDQVFFALMAMLLSSIGVMNSSSFFPEFVKARSAAGLLFAVIDRKPKTGDSKKGNHLTLKGQIAFEDVHFTYPQRPKHPVMNSLNFSASKGCTVALVGPSGSGKSTVISLLERFYDIESGFVKFDGIDVRTICLEDLRKQMALVGQEPRLFAGSIRDNIAFGLENLTDEQIRAACDVANASKFIANLPQGLDTEVGEKGTQLSGGQKQRIAIARAVIRDPKILLLDEATSALDSESERIFFPAVQEALERARAGRTCITIAHRLSSIQNADVIVFVEGGKVVEAGNHQQLMTIKGRYSQLIRKQSLAT